MKEKKPPTSGPEPESLTFEQALAALEAIVSRLEASDVPLEDLIASYEQGARLQARCETMLAEARRRIDRITARADGSAESTPFQPQAEEAPAAAGHGRAEELF